LPLASRVRTSIMARAPTLDALLTRDDFSRLALMRFAGRCCACKTAPATEAHHIFDRKLFSDGGYRLRNAAPVCADCHWKAEICAISACDMARMAGVWPPLAPPCAHGFGLDTPDALEALDKWGNMSRPDGSIAPGPLFHDDGCRKALASGGLLGLCYNAPGADPLCAPTT
jgi:hypothetical protein